VLCFECYRARIDRPERVKLVATPFPRILSARESAHRRRMLTHFAQASDSRALARFGPTR
jgi:hypothetical protein